MAEDAELSEWARKNRCPNCDHKGLEIEWIGETPVLQCPNGDYTAVGERIGKRGWGF